MHTTPAEKLILVMLSDIQEHLGIKGAVDPARIRAAVTSGNTWSLPSFHHEEYQKDEADHVKRVLSLWDLIEESIEALDPEERSRLPDGPGWVDGIRFPGFYNSERGNRCWAIAEHLTEHLGQWPRFAGRVSWQHDDAHDLDERYDRMLEAYPMAGLFSGRRMKFETLNRLLEIYNQPVRGKDVAIDDDPPFDITGV